MIPPAVRAELVETALSLDPTSPFYVEVTASAHRFLHQIESGRIRVLDLQFHTYGRILDRARRRIAKLERTNEHETPKADAEIVASVAQLIDEKVEFQVLCDDRSLANRVLRVLFRSVGVLTSADVLGEL